MTRLLDLEARRSSLEAEASRLQRQEQHLAREMRWVNGIVRAIAHEVVRRQIAWPEAAHFRRELDAFISNPRNLEAVKRWCKDDRLIAPLTKSIHNASSLWVSDEIFQTVLAAATTLPEVFAMEFSDVPFESGLAVLEYEFSTQDYFGWNMALSAISWTATTLDEIPGFLCALHAFTDDKPTDFPHLLPVRNDIFVPLRAQLLSDPLERLCASFLLLVGQPLASQVHRVVNRHAKKGTSKEDPITCIVLRRPGSRRDADESDNRPEWGRRWIVSAHWRNQWYPSEQRHRTILVGPYIKGPDDKPFIVKDRVYKWVR